jgi:hypothetical protein
MIDEFEFIHFIKHLNRFELQKDNIELELFFIALTTKLLMNENSVKEIIEVYLT